MVTELQPPVLRPCAVLLLDEASSTSSAIVRTLEDHGLDLVSAPRWTGLLEGVVDTRPELVVFERAMSGGPGPRLLAMVRVLVPHAVVIVVCEMGSPEAAADTSGVTLHLEPSDLRPLVAVLRHLGSAPDAQAG